MNTGNSRRIAALAILLAAAGMMPLAAQPFTAGNSGNNFYGGFKHVSPYAPKPSTHNHEVAVNFFHQGLAAQDCKPATKASPARSLAAQRVAVYCATATAQ